MVFSSASLSGRSDCWLVDFESRRTFEVVVEVLAVELGFDEFAAVELGLIN